MRNRLITGIDIGSSQLHGVVASLNPETGKIEILASRKMDSQGIRKGVVVEIDEAREALENMLRSLEDRSAADIREVICSISGEHVSSQVSTASVAVSRADNEVSEEDVERVIEAAKTISLPQNREIIHTIPRVFSCDDAQRVENPVGMKGVRLEVNALIIEAFSPYLKNLEKIFNGLGVNLKSVVHAPLAASMATLTKRQKELGVILIDIGAQTTGISVFEEEKILHAAVRPIGSSHISNDLAIGFQIPVDIAEKVKLKWGTPIKKDEQPQKRALKKIETKYKEEVKSKKINNIVEARLREIMRVIREELQKINKNKKLPAGAVLVGEGAKLSDLVEYSKSELNIPAQIGTPSQIEGITRQTKDPGFATCLGLLIWDKKNKNEKKPLSTLRNLKGRLENFFKSLVP